MQHRPGAGSGNKAKVEGNVQNIQEPKPGAELDSELQAHIGRHLKAAYEDILDQSVPDRFIDLLKALEAKESGQSGSKGGA
jgi:hypothetical protein